MLLTSPGASPLRVLVSFPECAVMTLHSRALGRARLAEARAVCLLPEVTGYSRALPSRGRPAWPLVWAVAFEVNTLPCLVRLLGKGPRETGLVRVTDLKLLVTAWQETRDLADNRAVAVNSLLGEREEGNKALFVLLNGTLVAFNLPDGSAAVAPADLAPELPLGPSSVPSHLPLGCGSAPPSQVYLFIQSRRQGVETEQGWAGVLGGSWEQILPVPIPVVCLGWRGFLGCQTLVSKPGQSQRHWDESITHL